MQKCRFYRAENEYITWWYISQFVVVSVRGQAGTFTDEDWQQWAQDIPGMQREEIGEDERMRLAGAPMLPGCDDARQRKRPPVGAVGS